MMKDSASRVTKKKDRGARSHRTKGKHVRQLVTAFFLAFLLFPLSSCETTRTRDLIAPFAIPAHRSASILLGPALADCGLISSQVAREVDRLLPPLLRLKGYALGPAGAEGELGLKLQVRVSEKEFTSGVRSKRAIAIDFEFYPAPVADGQETGAGNPSELLLLVRKLLETEESLASSYLLSTFLEDCVALAASELDKATIGGTEASAKAILK